MIPANGISRVVASVEILGGAVGGWVTVSILISQSGSATRFV